MLAQRFPNELWPEYEGAFAWQAWAALQRVLETKNAALQRMHVLEPHCGRKIDQHLDKAVDWYASRHGAAQQRLHVLWRVIDGPGFAIDCLPLFPAHARMRGADVLDIVFIEVRVHRDAFLPENLMVLRARQRCQAEELDDIERQLLLNDRDVTPNGRRGVRGETQDIARERDDALRLPGQQHLSVFGDLVLALLGPGEVVRIDILKTDEHARDTRAFRFLDEIRDLVAQGVDLNHEAERNCISLAQQDEPVEDRLPFSVPREVVIGDEEFVDALRPIETYEMLDVIGRAEA